MLQKKIGNNLTAIRKRISAEKYPWVDIVIFLNTLDLIQNSFLNLKKKSFNNMQVCIIMNAHGIKLPNFPHEKHRKLK